MKDELFSKLWNDALDQPSEELYIAEYGYPDWFEEIGGNAYEVVKTLKNIYTAAHMPFKDIIAKSGLSRADFCRRYCLTKSTVDKWASGDRNCPDYYRLLICRELGILDVEAE